MKTKLVIFAALWAVCAQFRAIGMAQGPDSPPPYYVVIGAFAVRDHANQFVDHAKKLNFNAESAINPTRNLYYVFVLNTEDKAIARLKATKIRKETPFADTWVYTGTLGAIASGQGSDVNPVSGQAIAQVEVKDAAMPEPKESQTTSAESPAVPVSDPEVPVAEEGSKNFLFKILDANDQKELQGNVAVIDGEKSKKVASFKGNQNAVVKKVNKSGAISLICEVFGYRKLQRDLNFDHPGETEGIREEGNQMVVPFELIRLKKGDISVMYNVFFYKDAAIMRPESKYEVNNLLTMMKENPNYKIRIHGHTNGNSPGKLISMGATKKFFSLTDTKEGFGSAKKLSLERSKLIREYLISEGVDEKRMEVKAWGGKKPVYDKMSPQAQSNVRVEIEIIEDK